MKSVNNFIVVSVDQDQKAKALLGNHEILLAKKYNTNRREQNPVLCKVVQGNKKVREGTWLLVHHNRFAEHSPHEIGGGLYSIPYNQSVFAKVDKNGEAHSVNGNIICEREKVSHGNILTTEKIHNDRFTILNDGCGYRKGQMVFTYQFSEYEIIYIWQGIEHRVIKIFHEDIVGVV
jgi:hypothetical protein